MRSVKFILEVWPDLDNPTAEELAEWGAQSIRSNPNLLWDIETASRVYRDVKLPAAQSPTHRAEVQAIIDRLDSLVPSTLEKLLTPADASRGFAEVRTALVAMRDEPR